MAHVINISVATGIVSSSFNFGLLTPVRKSGPKSNMDNYRPMTVLPVFSQFFEQCICKQLNDFLELNNLLSNHQFGFRTNRNTDSAVTLFTDHIRKSMNDEKLTSSIFIGVSKAFDTLRYAHNLRNLSSIGVKGVENELFENHLFNRKQIVIYDGVVSDLQYVLSGVPQRLILGPMLFLIAYDGLSEVLIHCKIIMYADDTVIYTSDKSFSTIKSNLTEDLARLRDVATHKKQNT